MRTSPTHTVYHSQGNATSWSQVPCPMSTTYPTLATSLDVCSVRTSLQGNVLFNVCLSHVQSSQWVQFILCACRCACWYACRRTCRQGRMHPHSEWNTFLETEKSPTSYSKEIIQLSLSTGTVRNYMYLSGLPDDLNYEGLILVKFN